jgi:hypothetical protein
MQYNTLWVCGVKIIYGENGNYRNILVQCLQLLNYHQEESGSNTWVSGSVSVEVSPFDFTITTLYYIVATSYEKCNKDSSCFTNMLHILGQHFGCEIGKKARTGYYLPIGTKISEIDKLLRELDPRLAWEAVTYINTLGHLMMMTRNGEKLTISTTPYSFGNFLISPVVSKWETENSGKIENSTHADFRTLSKNNN